MWAGSTERAEDRPARALGVRGLPGAGLVAEHLFRSLDFVYVPTEDVDEAARRWVEELGAELLWKVHAMGTVVAQLRVSEDGPAILLSGHLEGDVPILIYRADDYAAAVAELRAAGADTHEVEIPHGPCATFRAPGGQRLAVYELTRPQAEGFFAGRVDE